MNAAVLMLIALVVLTVGYLCYGRLLAKVFGLDPTRRTPAHERFDGNDFVPAKNWWMLFGHHFSSICGAGPIVGVVLAVVYWGWLPSLIWLLVGAIWMGAVSDFSSLFVSMRSKGQSIADIARPEISPQARLFFSVFIWISVILVIAVFAIFAAKTLVAEPGVVLPSFGLIPVAMFVGWMLYQRKVPNRIATPIGLALLLGLLFMGRSFHVELAGMGTVNPEMLWILILLAYCFVASVVPVQILLQPRDYLASFILFAVIAVGITSIFWTQPRIQQEAFVSFWPPDGTAGPLWPMLFVTIACGAISGFHSLVSSGTTCKQIDNERHACRIGYGGMLVECLVGTLVLICVTTGLSRAGVGELLKQAGPIAVFSEGFGSLSSVFLGSFGKPFAILALNAFILTTLDTATRIARYLTSELFGIRNKYAAGAIVVISSGALALTGQWNRLWPAFGAANQLIAGLALLVVSCWLMNRRRSWWFTLIPSLLMLVTTGAAFVYQLMGTLQRQEPDYFLALVTVVLLVVAVMVFTDGIRHMFRAKVRE
jgi:carbon starvation protein